MFHRMMQKVDRVVALCNWTRDLLLGNGVTESKITLCRQGINWAPENSPARRPANTPLRFAFLGRFDATKGADILVEALRNSNLPFQLDLFGVRQGEAGNQYANRLHAQIGGDARFRMQPALAPAEVIPALRNYDALAVPSQWLETGPLVVLEAFAAGTPVIGSLLGGIAELVTGEEDGLLVSPWNSVEAWTNAFERVIRQPEILDVWRKNISPPRHTRQVALEFMSLYNQLVRR
jgi:glycosyltransferase involved in cell wall biosynthesis